MAGTYSFRARARDPSAVTTILRILRAPLAVTGQMTGGDAGEPDAPSAQRMGGGKVVKTANITPYWHSHASPTAAAGATNRKEQVLRTASIRLLALTLLATPAALTPRRPPPQNTENSLVQLPDPPKTNPPPRPVALTSG